MWFIGVEIEQETSAPPPKKNPGSASVKDILSLLNFFYDLLYSLFHAFRQQSAGQKFTKKKKNREDQPRLLPEWVRWSAQEFPPFVPLEKVLVLAIYGNRSLINQSCLVKIAAWILSWFFSVLFLKSTSYQSTKEFKLGQYPPILTLVDNAYILQQITGTLEPGGLGESFVSSY